MHIYIFLENKLYSSKSPALATQMVEGVKCLLEMVSVAYICLETCDTVNTFEQTFTTKVNIFLKVSVLCYLYVTVGLV